jgi:hypothetical protein
LKEQQFSVFLLKKLHQLLLGEKPYSIKDGEWALLDRQLLGVVPLTLSISVAYNVVKQKNTIGLMVTLSCMYEKPYANNKIRLKLFNLKMVTRRKSLCKCHSHPSYPTHAVMQQNHVLAGFCGLCCGKNNNFLFSYFSHLLGLAK